MATCYFWQEGELRVGAGPSPLPQSKSPVEVKRKFGGLGRAVGGPAEHDDKGIFPGLGAEAGRDFQGWAGGRGQFHLVEGVVQRRGVSNLKSEASVLVRNGSWFGAEVLSPEEGGGRHGWGASCGS